VGITSQLSDIAKWQLTSKSSQPRLVTCEVLGLNGSTQLGELGPTQLAVAAGATAEQFSEVTTLAGSSASDKARIPVSKELAARRFRLTLLTENAVRLRRHPRVWVFRNS
jgi:hypothetical protein